MQPDTYAAGIRRRYRTLPDEVRAWVEVQLDGPVVSVRDVRGGFSPGVAAVVSSERSGIFVKAVGSSVNADAIRFYLQEAEVTGRLPALTGLLAPLATAELHADGEQYAVITYPALDGHPPQHPWRPADLDACLGALRRLSAELTPSPWPPGPADTRILDFFDGWRQISADGADPWQADPWVGPRLAAFVDAEEELHAQLPGDTLSHTDLRADNIMLAAGQVWFVDWAHARNAAGWVDAAILLGDVIASRADLADGGEIDVAAVARRHHQLDEVPFTIVWTLQVALAGALHAMSRQPSPPGLPTIRPWQGSTAHTLLSWCRRHAPRDW
jgi:hypothetical protein